MILNGYLVTLNAVPKKILFCFYKIDALKHSYHLSNNILLPVLFTQTSDGHAMYTVRQIIFKTGAISQQLVAPSVKN